MVFLLKMIYAATTTQLVFCRLTGGSLPSFWIPEFSLPPTLFCSSKLFMNYIFISTSQKNSKTVSAKIFLILTKKIQDNFKVCVDHNPISIHSKSSWDKSRWETFSDLISKIGTTRKASNYLASRSNIGFR